MLREERMSRILAIIEEKKYVTVQELQKLLYVSPPTIRRDLVEMERHGLLLRHHGGASMVPKGQSIRPTLDRISEIGSSAEAVTKVLSELIWDDSVLFVDASPHEQAVCDALLQHKNLLVVTTSISLTQRLRDISGSVHCLGGLYIRSSQAVVGEIAERAVRQYNFDFALITGAALNARGDITCGSLRTSAILRCAMGQAQRSIVLSIGAASEQRGICNISHINDADYLISDVTPPISGLTTQLIRL